MSQQRIRFIVSSAEEAVTVLRDRFEGKAKVVSVRQVEGTGLARFLQAPKLEVIAEMAEDGAGPASEVGAEDEGSGVFPEPDPVVAVAASAPSAPSAPSAESQPESQLSGLSRLLRAGGFSTQMLAGLQCRPDWSELEAMPRQRALLRVGMNLRADFDAIKRRPLGNRVAFIGGPGVGKTTALCKWLASEVFVRGKRSAVLKLDLERANPGDALAVFCEALGVPCARSIPDVPTLGPDESLFVDVPGIVPSGGNDVAPLMEALGPLFVTSRVIVINAAYDPELIKRAFGFAARAGCTHVVFTHLDELTQWGKLWEFLLDHQLTPLFLGTGPNIAGDLEENVFASVLARTFPEVGLQAAKSAVVQ